MCIDVFSFLLAKHREPQPSSIKLLLPIIPIVCCCRTSFVRTTVCLQYLYDLTIKKKIFSSAQCYRRVGPYFYLMNEEFFEWILKIMQVSILA